MQSIYYKFTPITRDTSLFGVVFYDIFILYNIYNCFSHKDWSESRAPEVGVGIFLELRPSLFRFSMEDV